jgi:hypothetical protein
MESNPILSLVPRPLGQRFEAAESPTTLDGTPTGEMAPSGKQRLSTPKRDADLSSLLNVYEKTEFLSLIAKITESMYDQISQTFDWSDIEFSAKPGRPRIWAPLPDYLKDPGLCMQGAQSDIQASVEGRVEHEQSIIYSPELKKEVLAHFKKWQLCVQKRFGEISVKKGSDVSFSPSNGGNPAVRGRGRGM